MRCSPLAPRPPAPAHHRPPHRKRKAQCIAIKAALRSGQDVDKAMLEAKLAKRVGMLEVLSAKIKAQAISEEKKLYVEKAHEY